MELKQETKLIEALLKVMKVAREQNIIIESISLPIGWIDIGEVTPREVLGIKIN